MKLSKTETKKIRKTLGYNYTNYILNVLNERGIKNRLGAYPISLPTLLWYSMATDIMQML